MVNKKEEDTTRIPIDLDAEFSVLGAMIVSPSAIPVAIDMLEPSDFYIEAHEIIFKTILDMFMSGVEVDTVTLSSELDSRGLLGDSLTKSMVHSSVDCLPSSSNIKYYCKSVRDNSTQRKILLAAEGIEHFVRSSSGGVEELVNFSERKIFEATQGRVSNTLKHVKDILLPKYINFDKIKESPGISTGYRNIDYLIGGIHPGSLMVVAARPGVGKTSLVLGIAQKVSMMGKGTVAVFSLEMSEEEIGDRIVSALSGVSSEKIRQAKVEPSEFGFLYQAVAEMEESDLYIDDSANLTMFELRSRVKRLSNTRNLALVVVDYLQLMSYDSRRPESRQQEVSNISRGLKQLAKEYKIGVIAVSQLNRSVESRQDKKPQLSDLRESGAIEQDADIVSFLYFDPEDYSNMLADLIVAKHRNGPTGVIHLVFTESCTRFRDLENNSSNWMRESENKEPVVETQDELIPW